MKTKVDAPAPKKLTLNKQTLRDLHVKTALRTGAQMTVANGMLACPVPGTKHCSE